MKKSSLLTTLFALAVCFALEAQTTKGSVVLSLHNFSPLYGEVGGLLAPSNAFGISFRNSKSETDGVEDPQKSKTTTIGLNASVQYFVIDNLSAGITLNFLNQSSKTTGGFEDYDSKTTLFMAGPDLRYFIPVSEKTKVSINAGAGFGSAKSEYNGDSSGDPTKLSRFGGGAGVNFFPNPHCSINLGLGYGAYIAKETYNNSDNKSTDSGITLDVGFSIYL